MDHFENNLNWLKPIFISLEIVPEPADFSWTLFGKPALTSGWMQRKEWVAWYKDATVPKIYKQNKRWNCWRISRILRNFSAITPIQQLRARKLKEKDKKVHLWSHPFYVKSMYPYLCTHYFTFTKVKKYSDAMCEQPIKVLKAAFSWTNMYTNIPTASCVQMHLYS